MRRFFKGLLTIILLVLSLNFITSCDKNNDSGNTVQTNEKFKVTFIYDNGTPNKEVEVIKNDKVAKPERPTKEGYFFNAWYTDSKFENEYNFSSRVTSNLTLYAKWTKNSDINIDIDPDYAYVDYDLAINSNVQFSNEAHTSANHKSFSLKDFPNGGYATNYNSASEKKKINGFDFLAYRYGKSGDNLILRPSQSHYDSTLYHGREGGVFNTTPFGGINQLQVTYNTGNTSAQNLNKPNVRFGLDDDCLDYVYFLEPSTSQKTITINVNLSKYQYFSINSGEYTLYVSGFDVEYDNDTLVNQSFEKESGENKVRINPIRYTYSLVPGESKITAPIEYEYDQNTQKYNVTKTKEFTYYTSDYVRNHIECKEAAIITDPMEVCIYYTLFKTWPANYAEKSNLSNISGIFGSNTRQVSKYSRTDGYCRAIPWNGNGVYYELDIDVDGTYSTSSRGVGRVVAWEKGWEATGYDNSPVCIYTDDHYNTFLEYLNNGRWSKRFNAEGAIASIAYSTAETVTFDGFDAKAVEGQGGQVGEEQVEKLINDEDYYGNYAPEELINTHTALFQKVTNNIGIVENNAYVIVNESSGQIYNNRNMSINMNNYTISLPENSSLDEIYVYYFEHISGNEYYMYTKYYGQVESYFYVPSDANKEGLRRGQESSKVTFDEYGNVNISNGDYYYRFNTANGGLWRCYTKGSQQPIQLYRFCDIKGATPYVEEDKPEMVASDYKLVHNLNEINNKNTYILVNTDYKKCLTDLTNSTYEEGEFWDSFDIQITEDAIFEPLYFVKHKNQINNYYEIYKLVDGVKYYMTYSKEDKSVIFSTTLDSYYFVEISSDEISIQFAYLREGELVPLYDDNNWWFVSYDATNKKFIASVNKFSHLKLYKLALPVETERTDYTLVEDKANITTGAPYLLLSGFSLFNIADIYNATDLNDATYKIVLEDNKNYLATSKDALYEALYFTLYQGTTDLYYDIYVLRDDVKYYLNYDKEANSIIYSTNISTYYRVIYISAGNIDIVLAEKQNDSYVDILVNEENLYLKYDLANNRLVASTYRYNEPISLFKEVKPVPMTKTSYKQVTSIDDINITDKYVIVDVKNGVCVSDTNGGIYDVYEKDDSTYLSYSVGAIFEDLHITSDGNKYYVYVIRDNIKYYLSFNKDTYEVYFSETPNLCFRLDMYYSTYMLAYEIKENTNNGGIWYDQIGIDGTSAVLSYDTVNKKFILSNNWDLSAIKIFKYIDNND